MSSDDGRGATSGPHERADEMTITAMPSRAIGGQGLATSAIGLGAMGLTTLYGGDTAGADPIAVIHRALDLGITLIDTSDAYGPSTNEEMVGRAVRDRRDSVAISTKFGLGGVEGQEEGNVVDIDGRPEYVKAACDASLRRLGIDHIDLYLQHRLDPDTPIEETVGAMGELVEAGKVRYIGLCEVGPSTIRRAHAVFPLSTIQSEYSLWTRDPEEHVFPCLRELGIGFTPYSPLGRGFLTGRFRSIDDLASDDWRRLSPRFQGENFTRNLRLVDRVRELAAGMGCTPAQLALAWVLRQGDWIVPFQGATTVDQLEENIACLEVDLTGEDLERIDAAAPVGATAGDAYPAGTTGAMISRD
jgi:aryl-alcohol dehydrogenase-like predicted oxidoreductase